MNRDKTNQSQTELPVVYSRVHLASERGALQVVGLRCWNDGRKVRSELLNGPALHVSRIFELERECNGTRSGVSNKVPACHDQSPHLIV